MSCFTGWGTGNRLMATLQEVCERLQRAGMPTSIDGDPSVNIERVNTLEDAGPSEISFLANPKYERCLKTTRAAAVILGEKVEVPPRLTVVRTPNPYAALRETILQLHGVRQHPSWNIHPMAVIAPGVRLGARPSIGPHVTIERDVHIGDDVVLYPGVYIGERCRLGDSVTLHPNVVLYEDTVLGHRVTIHAGSVVGEDGLGYAPANGDWLKIPQVGHVEIDDDAEIGSNCAIDRATLGRTWIGRGSKFSNLIAIGHGSKIGPSAMFVAQVGLAGSVNVGERVQMGGQVGVAGHLTIGDGARIGAKAGVLNDVDPGEYVLGQPAVKAAEARRAITLALKLPTLHQRIKSLEAEFERLREALQRRGTD
jgi:UDP-3-O-[3-hydroxymyristoyl] glucosamine N-acyltransferase